MVGLALIIFACGKAYSFFSKRKQAETDEEQKKIENYQLKVFNNKQDIIIKKMTSLEKKSIPKKCLQDSVSDFSVSFSSVSEA